MKYFRIVGRIKTSQCKTKYLSHFKNCCDINELCFIFEMEKPAGKFCKSIKPASIVYMYIPAVHLKNKRAKMALDRSPELLRLP